MGEATSSLFVCVCKHDDTEVGDNDESRSMRVGRSQTPKNLNSIGVRDGVGGQGQYRVGTGQGQYRLFHYPNQIFSISKKLLWMLFWLVGPKKLI